jgi:PAS domain S-box-containing protein
VRKSDTCQLGTHLERELSASQVLTLESEAAALRDHALDATSTFFVITRFMAPEPLIVYCNKAVAEQHGFSREELVGQPIRVLTQWVSGNPTYASDVATALRHRRTFQYKDEVTRRDGSTFWLGVAIRPIFDDAGRLTHSVAVGADITAKREENHKRQSCKTSSWRK